MVKVCSRSHPITPFSGSTHMWNFCKKFRSMKFKVSVSMWVPLLKPFFSSEQVKLTFLSLGSKAIPSPSVYLPNMKGFG